MGVKRISILICCAEFLQIHTTFKLMFSATIAEEHAILTCYRTVVGNILTTVGMNDAFALQNKIIANGNSGIGRIRIHPMSHAQGTAGGRIREVKTTTLHIGLPYKLLAQLQVIRPTGGRRTTQRQLYCTGTGDIFCRITIFC